MMSEKDRTKPEAKGEKRNENIPTKRQNGMQTKSS